MEGLPELQIEGNELGLTNTGRLEKFYGDRGDVSVSSVLRLPDLDLDLDHTKSAVAQLYWEYK